MLILAQSPQSPFADLIPSVPPCRNGAPTCPPSERAWDRDPPVGIVIGEDGSVSESQYLRLGRAANGEVWSIQAVSLLRARLSPTPDIWFRIDYRAVPRERARTGEFLIRVDCASRRIALLHSEHYGPDGRSIRQFDIGSGYPDFQYVTPGTSYSAIVNQACPR